MRPTRGQSGSWLQNMPKERRTALLSLAVLLTMLTSLIIYQRFSADDHPPQEAAESRAGDRQMSGETAPAEGSPQVHGQAEAQAEEPEAPRSLELMLPLAGERTVLQSYGFAYAKAFGDYRVHPGVDYQAEYGEPVLAAAGGKVLGVEEDPHDGRVVTIDHGHGMLTRYAGIGELVLSQNALVQPGTVIAYIGEPGAARSERGAHLHFQVIFDGEPVDPTPYITK